MPAERNRETFGVENLRRSGSLRGRSGEGGDLVGY